MGQISMNITIFLREIPGNMEVSSYGKWWKKNAPFVGDLPWFFHRSPYIVMIRNKLLQSNQKVKWYLIEKTSHLSGIDGEFLNPGKVPKIQVLWFYGHPRKIKSSDSPHEKSWELIEEPGM